MYTIYANDNLIYSPDLVSDGLFITNPSFSKEVNKSGSCQFYIYPENPFYDKIEVLKTIIVVKEDDEEVWRGRVLKAEKNFDKRKSVQCEGVFSYFVDSIIRPFKHTKTMPEQFRYIIEKHNEQIELWKQFEVGTIDVEDLYGSKEWEETSYKQTLDHLNGFLNDYGGYVTFGFNPSSGKNIISYVKNPGAESSQVIEFGENLLDLTETINPTNVFTVIIPVAYDSNGNQIDIKPYNNNKDYIESAEGVAKYGQVVQEYTLTKDYANANDVITDATKYLNDNIKASTTIEVKALDLHLLNPSVRRLNVYDIIKVDSKPHGINEQQMCSKITIDMENPDNSDYVIGTIPTGIEDIIAKDTKKVSSTSSSGGGGSSLPDGDNVQY